MKKDIITQINEAKQNNDMVSVRKLQEEGKKSLNDVEYGFVFEFSKNEKILEESIKNKNIKGYFKYLIEEYGFNFNFVKNNTEKSYFRTIYYYNMDTNTDINLLIGLKLHREIFMGNCICSFNYLIKNKIDISYCFDKYKKYDLYNKFTKFINNDDEKQNIFRGSLAIPEDMIKEIYKENKLEYQYIKNNKINDKMLYELLSGNDFENLNSSEYCKGLIYILCNKEGFNIRNENLHNYKDYDNYDNLFFILYACIISLTN
jgi:hypothetical protein